MPEHIVPEHKLLIVTWEDTSKDHGRSGSASHELREHTPALLQSIGFGYIEENAVVLASDYFPEIPERYQLEVYRDHQSIPKRAILDIRELITMPAPMEAPETQRPA